MKVQLEVIQKIDSCIWTEGGLRPGDVVWVSEEAGRHLLENNLCRWPKDRPTRIQDIGPTETKPFGPSEKKTFATGRQDGRLTDSHLSKEHGTEKPASVSAAALVSPQRI